MTPRHSEHLAGVLDATVDVLRSYIVIAPTQADAAALWVAHTHALDAFETSPYLAITSPEMRCGKSRLLDVLELLVARVWRAIMPSEAVLYRKIDSSSPTLLLDEADAIFDNVNGSTEPLRALLNAGSRRGTFVPRCVGQSNELIDFSVFCAKALAGIGSYAPDTVRDRSIVIRLERKRAEESVRRFRRREALDVAEPIATEFASWAQDALPDLEAARPNIPDGLDDRAEEAWEPLLAIADLAGGSWPDRARHAALELSAAREAEDEALGPMLLRDIRGVFESRGITKLSSKDLAASLSELEESPWGDIRGRALDDRALARRLKRHKIRPRSVRLDDGTTPKGYPLEAFDEAFARYLGDSERHTATTRMGKGSAAASEAQHVADEESRKPAPAHGCGGVADKTPEKPTRRESERPHFGEEGLIAYLKRAHRDGHLTHDELLEQLRAHGLVLRRLAPRDEAATIAAVEALTEGGS